MKSEFLTTLDGRQIDDENFMLLADLRYQSAILGGIVTVPKGFVTDFASVPRVPIIYEAFGDYAHHESVVHDFLYQSHMINVQPLAQNGVIGAPILIPVSKSLADNVFKEAMICRKKPKWKVWGMYMGVVLGGASSYASGPSRFKILNE